MSYSEFSFIESIKKQVKVPLNCEGIGDDCAVIRLDETSGQVITTDMLVEGVHFLKDKISPYQLGRKSVAVNLSDIAAMGAFPNAIFLSLSIPKGISNEWLDEFIKGVLSWNVPLLGGDTTASLRDIVINITACGVIDYKKIKRRSGAKVGDTIFVTGTLGESVAGLKALQKGIDNPILINAHNDPKPHIIQGCELGKSTKVHSMMDVSDGIASDLKHILKASNVNATIDTAKIPLTNTLSDFCKSQNINALELALSGGEDYVLLFTADSDIQMPFPIYPIGTIEDGNKNSITYTPQNIELKGFTHF